MDTKRLHHPWANQEWPDSDVSKLSLHYPFIIPSVRRTVMPRRWRLGMSFPVKELKQDQLFVAMEAGLMA
jgi:hypothetical protein